MNGRQRPTVLVVEDETSLARLYEDYLEDRYDVRVATSGEEALDRWDADVDVVLLDRRMPGESGDDVLRTLREQGFEGPAAMVTAVEPGPDIVNLPCDDYIVKPVSRGAVSGVVETLLRREAYDEAVREHFAVAAKHAALEAEHTIAELESSPEYRELRERLESTKSAAQDALEDMSPDEIDSMFRAIDVERGTRGYFDG